jgi:hypothetical protein
VEVGSTFAILHGMKKQFTLPMIASLALILSACNNADLQAAVASAESTSQSNSGVSATPTPVPATPTPTASATPVDVADADLVGSWSISYVSGATFVNTTTVGADASVQASITRDGAAYCTQSGSITQVSPSTSCSGNDKCGSATLLFTSSTGNSSCMATGSYTCNYTVVPAHTSVTLIPSPIGGTLISIPIPVAAALTLNCGFSEPAETLIQVPTPSPSPSPGPGLILSPVL